MSQAESTVRQQLLVIDKPAEPEKPDVSRRRQLTGALVYLVVGILLTVVAVAGGALMDRSFRIPLDVRRAVDLPVLAVLPEPPRRKRVKAKPAAPKP
jgi:capsular polysaccharide biosynthesis protein